MNSLPQKNRSAIIGVGVMLFVDGKVLMLKGKKGDHWTFIGGKAEEGETPLETCARETMEETGLVLDNLKLEDVFFRWGWASAEVLVGILYSAYLPDIPKRIYIKKDEIDDYAWIDQKDLDKYNIPSDQRESLKKYFHSKSSL